MIETTKRGWDGLVAFLGFLTRFTIYHFIPMVSTTAILIMAICGGLSLSIFIDYLCIVLFSCILLAFATLTGR